MRIERKESSLADFILKFNMAKDKCLAHGKGTEKMFSDRVITSLLLEAASLSNQDRKVVVGAVKGDLTKTDEVADYMKEIIAQSNPMKSGHFVDESDECGRYCPSSGPKMDLKEANSALKKSKNKRTKSSISEVGSCATDGADANDVQKAYVAFDKTRKKFDRKQKKWTKINKRNGNKGGNLTDKETPGKNRVDRMSGKRMKCWMRQ